MDPGEARILEALDAAVRSKAVESKLDAMAVRVETKLRERAGEVLAWEPVPLNLYPGPLPKSIRSSWVFILRAGAVTGAERHPNSRQRMMSYRGSGDFQTRTGPEWRSHFLKSDAALPLEKRWISIPPLVWHQAVVPPENWVVVSFHTASEEDLIEERPSENDSTVRRKYSEEA
ncbi:MAG TPA: hypothetical protein VGR67_16390 [Candidatus Polarisedimenticolia bacterium]|jgi:hypothetical protein|nr:hypothetical protein [Candidatus Polarisedimenticolia bacterium]